MQNNESFEKLYIEQLRDVYNAEKQLVRVLPKMAKAASSEDLRSAIEEHLEKTRHHVERIEGILDDLGKSPSGKTCKGMSGIIDEGQEILNEDFEPEVLDAGIIASAQRVEHYEIAAYGTLRAFAELKGDQKAAQTLQDTLDEEYEADKTLTRIAESSINANASGMDSVDREERSRPGGEMRAEERREKGDGPWV